MANDEQTSTCSSFSNAREQLESFNEHAPSNTEPQELNLWSPPATFGAEEAFGVLPQIDEWAKLLDSNVQPVAPSSESQEILQQIQKLEQSFQQLRQ